MNLPASRFELAGKRIEDMEKMTGKSMDLIAENIKQMKALFPEAVTEGKIDFEVLKALLGEEVEKRQTYYKFTWNGKEEARAYARVPSMGTLRPCVEESSGKDGTPGKFDSGNLYIEGDNLEVLKLLQGSYHKRVKMIYIDPPYNTGKDFVYPDDYRNPIGEYKALTGQTDDDGVKTRANPETSGRYHTDWLNMMYPRLILARNLLTDDGVIFISIDDSEQDNLKKLCNEVLGEENFIAQISWRRTDNQPNIGNFARVKEYIVIYSKSTNYKLGRLPLTEKAKAEYRYFDEKGAFRRAILLDKTRGRKFYPKVTKLGNTLNGPWMVSEEEFDRMDAANEIYWTENGDGQPYGKIYLNESNGQIPNDFWGIEFGTNQRGSLEVESLFEKRCFDFPKPVLLLYNFAQLGTEKDSIILDFFSGSATTAHSVMQLNAEDGGNRKFIMVQLPEACEEGTEAVKAGYKNICEIGKERIRRAAKKIKDENPLFAGDMGFKVFKLDTSNIRPWNPDPDKIELSMYDSVENILKGRSREDLLYEVLLKCNLPLTLSIEEKKFGENTVYIVGSGMLAICLDKTIPQTIAEEIVKLRDEYAPIVPMQVVFRDNGFTDVAKTNVLQILQQAGFEEKSVQTI